MRRLSVSSLVVIALALAGAAAPPARHVESLRLAATVVRTVENDAQHVLTDAGETPATRPACRTAVRIARRAHVATAPLRHALYQRPPPSSVLA